MCVTDGRGSGRGVTSGGGGGWGGGDRGVGSGEGLEGLGFGVLVVGLTKIGFSRCRRDNFFRLRKEERGEGEREERKHNTREDNVKVCLREIYRGGRGRCSVVSRFLVRFGLFTQFNTRLNVVAGRILFQSFTSRYMIGMLVVPRLFFTAED